MKDRLQLKIKEFKFYIQLHIYNQIIEDIVNKIYSKGCKLMAYTQSNSKHQVTEVDCIICLDVRPARNRLHLLWDLFHELGHHIDPDKLDKKDITNIDRLKIREQSAWKFADEEFLKYPELEKERNNYINYRSNCLLSYEINDYSGKL